MANLISPAAAALGISLAAAALWGSGDFCGGLAGRRTSPYLVVTLAHGLSLALLVAVAVSLRLALPDAHVIRIAMGAGVAGGIGLIFFYEALALGRMGLSASLGGVITALIPLIFSLRTEGLPHPVQLGGFVTATVAIWMIAYAPGGAHPRGLGLAACAGVCFGILLTLLKLAAAGEVIWVLAFMRLGSFGTAAALALARWARQRSFQESSTTRVPGFALRQSSLPGLPSLLGLIVLAGILDTGGNLLYTIATRMGRLDMAAVVSSLYPAATILLAAWLLKERTSRIQSAGMALALVAVGLISR